MLPGRVSIAEEHLEDKREIFSDDFMCQISKI